jgi:hypothetical protein
MKSVSKHNHDLRLIWAAIPERFRKMSVSIRVYLVNGVWRAEWLVYSCQGATKREAFNRLKAFLGGGCRTGL